MNDKELLQQALDALEKHVHEYETIQAIKTRLEPQKKEWVGLTDREIDDLDYSGTRVEFARDIEAKLKEKNNG